MIYPHPVRENDRLPEYLPKPQHPLDDLIKEMLWKNAELARIIPSLSEQLNGLQQTLCLILDELRKQDQ